MQMESNEISNHQLTRSSRPIMGSHNRTSTRKLALSPNIEIKFRAEKKNICWFILCNLSQWTRSVSGTPHNHRNSHVGRYVVAFSCLIWRWTQLVLIQISGFCFRSDHFLTSCRYRLVRAQHVIQQVLWSPRYNRKKEIYLGIMRTRWLTHLSGLMLPDCCEI